MQALRSIVFVFLLHSVKLAVCYARVYGLDSSFSNVPPYHDGAGLCLFFIGPYTLVP